MSTKTLDDLDRLIAGELAELIAIRHDLHAHPQLAFEETHASAVVQRELAASGVAFRAGVAETGVVAWIEPTDEAARWRPAVALRADMDALPIDEETGLPYASKHPGLMHACGHDGHTAILIGAARVLNRMRERLPRPVKFVFQPAEEGRGGAKIMIDRGVLTRDIGGAEVGAMFGLHGFPLGKIGTLHSRSGPVMAAADELRITISGRGGHAAAPYQTIDPVVAAAHVVTAIQTVVSRNLRPTDAAVVSITSIHAGRAFNVIPERVEMLGTIRSLSDATGSMVRRRVTEIAEQTAAALGCRAAVEIIIGYPVLRNDEAMHRYAMATARRVLGDDGVITMDAPVMGAEDFAYYAGVVPAHFAFLGVIPHDRESYPGLHHPRYDFNDAALPIGVRLMCRWALDSGAIADA